jgi:hypothetical protein
MDFAAARDLYVFIDKVGVWCSAAFSFGRLNFQFIGANVMHSYFQVCCGPCLIGSESFVLVMIIYAAKKVLLS